MKTAMLQNKSVAFTLIELLVVVAIILLIAGLLLPALMGTKTAARKTKARREVAELATAWKQYMNDYRVMPRMSNGGDLITMDGSAIALLRGDTQQNMNAIGYLDFAASTTNYCDPWGNVYNLLFDYDHDGKVALPAPDGGGDVFSSVAVWSTGPNGRGDTTNYIRSWQ